MARTESTISLAKFDLNVINCTMCKHRCDTTQKPVHAPTLLTPRPLLFISPMSDEIDLTTSLHLTAPWGKWLTELMDTFLSRKEWTVHNLVMCKPKVESEMKTIKSNCLYHYIKLLDILNPFKVIFMGIGMKDIPANLMYTSKTKDYVYLHHPSVSVPMNDRLALSRFTLTIEQICNAKKSSQKH